MLVFIVYFVLLFFQVLKLAKLITFFKSTISATSNNRYYFDELQQYILRDIYPFFFQFSVIFLYSIFPTRLFREHSKMGIVQLHLYPSPKRNDLLQCMYCGLINLTDHYQRGDIHEIYDFRGFLEYLGKFFFMKSFVVARSYRVLVINIKSFVMGALVTLQTKLKLRF